MSDFYWLVCLLIICYSESVCWSGRWTNRVLHCLSFVSVSGCTVEIMLWEIGFVLCTYVGCELILRYIMINFIFIFLFFTGLIMFLFDYVLV